MAETGHHMRMNENIYNDIVAMGFPEDQARKAASRFGNGDAAINWILEGMPEGSGGPVSTYRPCSKN
jgi:uncharacterized UBP type Zn finger protein